MSNRIVRDEVSDHMKQIQMNEVQMPLILYEEGASHVQYLMI